MTSPDPTRRRLLLALGAGTTLLAGCGDTDTTTPEPAPPPENGTVGPGTPEPETAGPGPGEETPAETETPPQATGTDVPDDVVFSKPGGGEVSATIYGSGDCAVVLVPQADTGRQSWHPYAQRLASNGYVAVAIDEGDERKAAGVTATVQYLKSERDVASIVAVGASSGAAAAIRAVAEQGDRADGVVAISPAGGADVAANLEPPTMVVVSEDDGEYVETARAIAEDAPGARELVTFPGDAHGQQLFDTEHAEALRTRISDFLAEVCGTPAE